MPLVNVYCFSNTFLRRNTYCYQKLKQWSGWIDMLLPCLISKIVILLVLTCLCFKILHAQVCILKTDSTMWFRINTSDYERHSVQFSLVAQSCLTLCDPMNRSMPGLPVHHQLPEFTQTQVHQVGDAIQASHPLSSPSPPAPNPSQHQSLFQWVSSLHEVATVLEFQL